MRLENRTYARPSPPDSGIYETKYRKGPFAQREESANYHDDAFFSCVDLWIVIQAWASMSDAKTKAKQDSKGFSYGKWSCTCKRWYCGICLIIEGLNSTRWCLPACLLNLLNLEWNEPRPWEEISGQYIKIFFPCSLYPFFSSFSDKMEWQWT